MKRISAAEIPLGNEMATRLPAGFRVIHVRASRVGFIELHYLADDGTTLVDARFAARYIGHPVEPELQYIGTVYSQPHVVHIWHRKVG